MTFEQRVRLDKTLGLTGSGMLAVYEPTRTRVGNGVVGTRGRYAGTRFARCSEVRR